MSASQIFDLQIFDLSPVRCSQIAKDHCAAEPRIFEAVGPLLRNRYSTCPLSALLPLSVASHCSGIVGISALESSAGCRWMLEGSGPGKVLIEGPHSQIAKDQSAAEP